MIFPLLKHITHRLIGLVTVAAIMATALWSCSDYEPDFGGVADAGDGTVSFRVVTPKYAGSSSGSRATWGDKYDNLEGTEFETALTEGQVQVVITDASCSQQYAITDLQCVKVTDNALFVAYEYVGRIEESGRQKLSSLTDGKFHIIANAGPGAILGSDPVFMRSGQASEFDAIPMWGVKTVDFSQLVPANMLNIGDINLLRSMAKVVIDLDPEAGNYIQSINSVTISATNRTGYVLPAGWTEIGSTETLNRHAARVPDQVRTGARTYKMDEKSHVEFYLPEIINGTGDELTLTLNYTTVFGEMSGKLYFRRYTDGNPGDTPLDVLRNYQYHFYVKKPNHEEVNAILDVIPYSSVELDPDFGLERDPINGWICFRNEQGYLMSYFDDIKKEFYDFDRQRITYDVHPTKASWLKVITAAGDFAWYFDVETGKMYDIDENEMTGLDRHPVTGWLVRRLPNGEVDYYVAAMANKVFDRNQNEVELESRDGTNNYKLLRDGDGNIIIKFDPLTGTVLGSDDKTLTFDHDEDGCTIITNNEWYCLYNRATGKFYNSDHAQIKNPFTNPSWQQYLYSNGSLICYYDQETGKFYDIDLDEITFETHPTNPWFRVVDSKDNFCWYLDYTTGAMYDEDGKRLNLDRDRTTGNIIRRGAKQHIAYYVDPVSLLVYDSHQNLVRLEHRNEKTNALKVLNFEGTGSNNVKATYYFDAAAGILYDQDRQTVIYDRLHKTEALFNRDAATGRVIIPDNNENFFRYYDIDESQFYTKKGIPVSNPFSTQLTPYDDIKNADGVFTCFYNQIEDKFYDGYMREITHEQHKDNPWFKVCDYAGNFKWYVDYLTFKLYNINGAEIASPTLYHRYNGSDVRVTSGKRDAKTGRVEFIFYRGPSDLIRTTSYWLDPLSLVIYDPTMREIILPRKTNKTNALKQFKDGNTLLFDFDVFASQLYQGSTPKELNVKYTTLIDNITNKKTINAKEEPYVTRTGIQDLSPATYTINASGYPSLGTDQFRFTNGNGSGIVSTASGGKLKSIAFTVKSGWGGTNGQFAIHESNSPFKDIAGMTSSNLARTINRSGGTSFSYTSTTKNNYVGVRSASGNQYFDYINFEWEGTTSPFYVLTFYNSSGTEVAIHYRPYSLTFHSATPLRLTNLINIANNPRNPFIVGQ